MFIFISQKFLASTPEVTIKNIEEYSKENNDPYPRIPKQIYQGDRFIPCRHGYSFDRAHSLITNNEFENMDGLRILDVFKQV